MNKNGKTDDKQHLLQLATYPSTTV